MQTTETTDPAAIFAIATSLWDQCHNHALADSSMNLSDAYGGANGLMREVMRVATLFESWSCEHVAFDQLTDVWPYLLEDRFGTECLSVLLPGNLAEFDEHDCRRIAGRLRLRLRHQANTGIPTSTRYR
jgi:hypothetical protein